MRLFRNKTGSVLRYERSDLDIGGCDSVKVSGTLVTRGRKETIEFLGPKNGAWAILQDMVREHHMQEVCAHCGQTLEDFEVGQGVCVDCYCWGGVHMYWCVRIDALDSSTS